MSIEFGIAKRDELPQLVGLLGILFSQEAEFAPDEAKQTRALERILSDASVGTVFVAREEGRVVAMASLLYTVSTAEGGTAALFEDLVVLPGHRGRGIASSLVQFVVQHARKQGVLRLTLLTDMQNHRAQALYRKLGFADSTMKPMRLKP
ncbi:MAG TPA: GNAT family N-acetyltransferase [Burkholderiales bacterium]|nr:GNAT family N-acetyltransferase [Burkholderiales bacterium]